MKLQDSSRSERNDEAIVDVYNSDNTGVNPNIGVFPPKWMVYFMENPIKIDDLGVPLFLETPTLTINVNYIFGLPPTQDSSHKMKV